MNYKEDVRIDESALDVEWLRQPSLVLLYNRNAAYRKQLMDQAKERVDIVKAELDQKIRRSPNKYKLDKVTNETVGAAVILTKEYQDARYDFIDKKYEADMAQAAVWALNDKKTALENLVRLHGSQYFAGPSVPRDLNKEWEAKERDKAANKKIAIKSKKGVQK